MEEPELKCTLEQETLMNKNKFYSIEKLTNKSEEYEKLKSELESQLNESISIYKNQLISLEIKEKWIREALSDKVLVSDIDGEKCFVCNSTDDTSKKYFCPNCRGKFCISKCLKQCKGVGCNKYVCPIDNKKCKLCHKTNYCDSCQKKCFYQLCMNTFCPDCYKKNEHQARNQNINCKFFTCDKDNVCDCLMTSMFCSKCETRLCNNCLLNDTDHFPFLK